MPGFAGFDASNYPGDVTMNWLKANTNLVWCGYYLIAPSHLHSTWLGKRAQLSAAGWGLAPVFVGQQVIPPGSQNPSAATGVTDGTQAVQQMTNEGFAPGSCVYLDLENGPPLTAAQRDYMNNWCDTVQQGGFTPGVYCSHLLAQQVNNLRPDCRIWAFKIPAHPDPVVSSPFPTPDPSGCGFPAAFAWQRDQNRTIKVLASHSSLLVDLNSGLVQDPGAPLPAQQDAAAAG